MAKQEQITVTESEAELVAKAQTAVSRCNWVVGECAAKWTKKYAKGRTDADLGEQVGLSGDQIFQRRRVWETFSDVYESYSKLKWSHFYVALNWDDAPECLQWAEENETTVAEMRAWRRALRGEDLSEDVPLEEWGGEGAVSFVPSEPTSVRDPDSFGQSEGRPRSGSATNGVSGEPVETVAAFARESGESDYSPFRKGAGSPAPKEDGGEVAVIERPQPSASQLIKRVTNTLERMNKALTSEMLKEIGKLPEKQRTRFVKAVGELSSKAAGLM